MKNMLKPFTLTALVVLSLAGCMTEKERQAIAAEKARQKREALVQTKLKAKQLMADRKWQEVVDLCEYENDAELAVHVKVARQHLAQEALRRERTERVEGMAVSCLESIRETYSEGMTYTCPFPRKNRGGDWLAKWKEPRRELSDEDKLAGESRLEEFGTKYLPNAYANYEKVRDAARELQQVFNEEFPKPWTIKDTSPKWNAFNKMLEKFAKVRTEYFLCHDEICHYWMLWRLGVLNADDLANVDSQKLTVSLLPENFNLTDFKFSGLESMENGVSEFAAKYTPESYAIYLKLTRDLNAQDALLKEVVTECRMIDHVRYDRALVAAVLMRNDIVRELNSMSLSFQTWRMDHRIADKTSEDMAKCDHEMALRLKPFVESLSSYVKDRILCRVIPKEDMIQIPGKYYRIQRTEVTQSQWIAVMGSNPSRFEGNDRPVENVSWDNCKQFIENLNAMPEVKASGLTFRLPTEEEWEYACRAGSTGDYCKLADGTEITESTLGEVAWYEDNSDRKTHPVGQKKPNAFGLYDMHGNVCEWCDDLAGDFYRVYRGGGWGYISRKCSADYRDSDSYDYRDNDLGFRLAASARP